MYCKKVHLLMVALAFAPWYVLGQGFINVNTAVKLIPAERINTKFLEFSPQYYASGIVFVHAKEQGTYLDRKIGAPYFEIMYAEISPAGEPGRGVSFSPNIRTRFHEGPTAFSPDQSRIYFTRSNYSGGKEVVGSDGKSHMKIYTAVKGSEDWEDITEVPFCDDDFDTWGPTLSISGEMMLFVSNRPGGYGGMDLYTSELIGGVWSEPVNLGNTINSADHEAYPFLHQCGVLFFARDSKDGMGKFDLYAVDLEAGSPVPPVNLGAPFNGKWDDLSIIVGPDGKSGFFASSRRGGKGKDDIYRFECPDGLIPAERMDAERPANTKLLVSDGKTGEILSSASIWAIQLDATGADPTAMELGSGDPTAVTDATGLALVEALRGKDMLVMIRAEGYEDYDVLLPATSLGKNDPIKIQMRQFAGPVVGVGETGDCVSTSARVFDNASRQPLESVAISFQNHCTNSIRVLQTGQDGKLETCLDVDCTYDVFVELDGYVEGRMEIDVVLAERDYSIFLDRLTLEERAGDLAEGDVLLLSNIYYDFNKSVIRSGHASELASLASIMSRYPSMRIELRSYTDSRGEDMYNLELAEMRAISALEFLASRGVDPSRVELAPKGEVDLVNHCQDGVPCSEEEHAVNRRTEIVILEMPQHAREEIRPGQN